MSARSRLFVALVSTGLVGFLLVGSVMGRVWGDSAYGQLTLFNEVLRHVLDGYVDALAPERIDDALDASFMGLTDALDGDTAYLPPEDWRSYKEAQRAPEADTGIVLGRRYGFLVAVATRSGSPAEKAGVRKGDFIKTIDNRHTRSLSVPVGDRLLHGAPGSTVKLRLIRSRNEPVEVSIVRERIEPIAVRSRALADGIGYVRIPEFSNDTAKETREAVEAFKRAGVRKIVLDLRGTAYGPLAQGAAVAQLFVGTGVVARQTFKTDPEKATNAEASRVAWSGPLATLVDFGTAGASEIVSAALLDSGRSPVVGQRTYGRVGLQQPVPIDEGGMVVTVSRFVSPKGNVIHGKGVEPDVPVTLPAAASVDAEDDEPAVAEPKSGEDPVLDKALEILKSAEAKKAA